MKKSVKLSTWCIAMTLIGLAVVLIVLYCADHPAAKWIAAGAFIILCLTALFFMPLSVSIKDGGVNINRPLKTKSIPLNRIASAKLCPPTMAEKRICGSGGWFGYWGWFSEPSIGKYFAYYGKASDCFLVELKDGKKYMLGCEDAPAMVELINSKLSD